MSDPDWHWGAPYMERLTLAAEGAVASAVKTPNQTKAKKRDFVHFPRPGERAKHATTIGNNPQPLADVAAWMKSRTTST